MPEKRMRDEPQALPAVEKFQRRVDLKATAHLPQAVAAAATALQQQHPSALGAACCELTAAATPDLQLRVLSRVNEGAAALEDSADPQSPMAAFVRTVAGPLLLDARARYLHKGLLNVVRHHCPVAAAAVLPPLFVDFTAAAERALQETTDHAARLSLGMYHATCVDCVIVLVASALPGAFAPTALPSLPLFATLLRLTVDDALRVPGVADDAVPQQAGVAGDLLGAPLDRLRFVARTATTLLHKFCTAVAAEVRTPGPSGRAARAVVAGLAAAVMRMLRCATLPKDLMNAAALLAVTVLALRGGQGLADRIAAAAAVAATLESPRADSDDAAAAESVLDPESAADTVAATERWFHGVTANGALALHRGLLAHCTFPDDQGRPILLAGAAPLLKDMVPFALSWCGRLDAPDTRFSALQTVDALVKHLAAVLPSSVAALGPSTVSMLEDFTRKAGRLVMAMWDDPTQRVSGPLYGTFDSVLTVLDLLRPSGEGALSAGAAAALAEAVALSDERRGRYQALCALIPRCDLRTLLAAFSVPGGGTESLDDLAAKAGGPRGFVEGIMRMTHNTKVASLVGDAVLAMVARIASAYGTTPAALLQDEAAPAAAVWRSLVRRPLLELATAEDAVLSTAVVTHVAMPLLRAHGAALLASLVGGLQGSAGATERALVRLLYRARSVGVDVVPFIAMDDATVAAPAGERVVAATRAADAELRLQALELLVLGSKLLQPLSPAQFALVEAFLHRNLSNAFDATFRNRFATLLRKWFQRVADTATSAKVRAPTLDPARAAKKAGKLSARHAAAGSAPPPPPQVLTAAEAAARYGEYCGAVARHVAAVAELCVRHSAPGLATEHRHAALSTLVDLGDTAAPLFAAHTAAGPAPDVGAVAFREALLASPASALAGPRTLLPPALWPTVAALLDDGWDRARGIAATVARRMLAAGVVGPADALGTEEAQWAALRGSATFRHSEGAVQRLLLSAAASPALAATACATLRERLTALDTAPDLARFAESPVHGLISLLAKATLAAGDTALVRPALDATATALRVCTTLVSEAPAGSDLQTEGEAPRVDCRGHVISAGPALPEATLRMVVNNAWLGARAATAGVEALIQAAKLPNRDVASPAAVEAVCTGLVDVLLRTKHNGVIGRSKQCLLGVTSLLLRSPDAEYRAVPQRCLEYVLFGAAGVQSTDKARMLRRSQGLPHAMLPLLDAEDPAVPAVLLPTAVAALLDIAQGATVPQAAAEATEHCAGLGPKAAATLHGVNAMNVLKYVVDDSALATRLTPWLEGAFVVAATGFRSEDWFVRNSAMMLFASVLRRVVGDHPFKGGRGVGTTFTDLAQRFPRIAALVCRTLRATVVESTAPGAPLRPEVYPLLLLLSLLRPEVAAPDSDAVCLAALDAAPADPDAAPTTAAAIGAAAGALRISTLGVRVAAANALAALLPPAAAAAAITRVAHVPAGEQDAAHGQLLFVLRVLRTYCGWEHDGTPHSLTGKLEGLRLHDAPASSAAVAAASAVVVGDWCATIGKCAPQVRQAWFTLAAEAFRAAPAPADVQRGVLAVAAPVLAAGDGSAPHRAASLMTATHDEAAQAVRAVLHVGGGGAEGALPLNTEVLAALSAVAEANASLSVAATAETLRVTPDRLVVAVATAACDAVEEATGSGAVPSAGFLRRTAALLTAALWCARQRPELLGATRVRLAAAAQRCLATTALTQLPALCSALHLLALLHVGGGAATDAAVVVAALEEHARPAAPLDCREAAVQCLGALYHGRSEGSAEALVALLLGLFDDDPAVRCSAAAIVSPEAPRCAATANELWAAEVRRLALPDTAARIDRLVAELMAGGDDGDGDDDDEVAAGDVLFEEEGDNVFADALTLGELRLLAVGPSQQ